MKRDFVCICRCIIDSLPTKIRNSYILFSLVRKFFNLPIYMFEFRKKYDNNEFPDISMLYNNQSAYASRRISPNTDINSYHLSKINSLIRQYSPKSILDLGCGNGFLLNEIHSNFPHISLTGIDFSCCPLKKNRINYIEKPILNFLLDSQDNSFDLILSTHTLEHIEDYKKVILNIKRVSKKFFLIVCPMEKKFKWGLNYHINFFPNEKSFIKAMQTSSSYKLNANYLILKRLGDILYFEDISSITEESIT